MNCQWFLALYIVNGIKGNIFVNGIVYSFVDGSSMIMGGYIINRYGTANTGKFVNILGLICVTIRLFYPEIQIL
jgi:hypothetical protein